MIKSALASRYTYSETLSATIALSESLEGKHLDNPFVVFATTTLKKHEADLRASIAFHDQNNRAEESDTIDGTFNESYKKLRSVVELYGDMHEFGEVAANCSEIRDIIHRHGRNLHQKPKDEQISLFDSVLAEIPAELVDAANVRPLFDPVVAAHNSLKRIEKERSAATANSEAILSPTEISKALKPLITKIHNHLIDFADFGVEEYIDTLAVINAKLAPIVTRVKTRKTRQENEVN